MPGPVEVEWNKMADILASSLGMKTSFIGPQNFPGVRDFHWENLKSK